MFLRYAFLADSAFLDAQGKVTATGIFDYIYAAKFPVKHRDMVLVAKLEGTESETGDHKFAIEMRDDKSNRLVAFEQKIALTRSETRTVTAGVIIKIQDFVFQKPGQYELVMFVNDRFLGRVIFEVRKVHIKEEGAT
ncbi:MAG TPA: hypothetical protein VNL36_05210 [Bacteroidota bacterium]|nr:hypothetical protein [Bacteroidota bacterium]